jgi:bifunctional DNA-binding transcriptional regulator/antitoxin component of YhaV-PrlF toxin-antitoxin module
MHQIKTKLGEGGQIVIPPKYLQALGLEVGDMVILRLEDGEVRIFTPQQAIRKAQGSVSISPRRKISER